MRNIADMSVWDTRKRIRRKGWPDVSIKKGPKNHPTREDSLTRALTLEWVFAEDKVLFVKRGGFYCR